MSNKRSEFLPDGREWTEVSLHCGCIKRTWRHIWGEVPLPANVTLLCLAHAIEKSMRPAAEVALEEANW
jgi:hypothetical protein